ncbi:MAG TPA: hypothetical protein VFS36_13940 [Chitinophagaceae bacterium]|jgi:LEA14-like dessication related protein|nr:hypothetical protein [Chitinophagaceae bacterium]
MSRIFWGLLLLAAMGSCTALKEPEYKGMESVSLQTAGLNATTLSLNLHYFNPNRRDLKLKESEGDAYIDSIYLGHFILDSMVTIPATADFTVPISLQTDSRNLLKNTMSLLLKKEVTLRLNGSCKIGRRGIYFRYPIRYEGKQSLASLGLFQ